MVLGQRLLVRVHRNELHALQAIADHAVHGVAAAAANTDYLDRRNIFVHFFIEHQCHNFVLHPDFIVELCRTHRNINLHLYNCIVSSFCRECKSNLRF